MLAFPRLGLLALASLGVVAFACSSSSSDDDGTLPETDGGSVDTGTTFDATTPNDGAAPAIDAGPPEDVHFLGRFDTSDPKGPRFAYPGSTIGTSFTGTGIAVTLADQGDDYFTVVVDDGKPTALHTSGTQSYVLVQGLATGTHTVTIAKRTESFQGIVQFQGFAPIDGAIVPTPFPFTRKIEMIGDSITCGYGDLGAGPSCHFSADTEDETQAWGAVAAASLGAMHTAISYSGKGVFRNNDGSTTDLMPEIWTRTFADDSTSTWDFTKYVPDVVVVNLATNDFSKGDPGNDFITAYGAFLNVLRTKYPSAHLVGVIGTMLGEPQHTTALGYVQAAVKAANDGGDAKVTALDLGIQDQDADGIGCDYHPSVATQAKMGAKLAAHVKTIIGW
ncbi:MAG TPA: SGNH/GDSL hydrolase family protein [Polyangiaceae bacterium]